MAGRTCEGCGEVEKLGSEFERNTTGLEACERCGKLLCPGCMDGTKCDEGYDHEAAIDDGD